MIDQSSIQSPSGVTAEQILRLGEQLAEIPSYDEQRQCLINFLQKNFTCEAEVWLNDPPKQLHSTIQIPQKHPYVGNVESSLWDQSKAQELQDNEGTFHIAAPLMRLDHPIGWIILSRDDPFTDFERKSILEVGKIAGLAFYTTFQSHLQNWRQKQLTLVRSVTAQISQITDLDILTREITRLVQETFNYYYVAVFLINEETGRLHFKASASKNQTDVPDFELTTAEGFDLGKHIIGHVAATGEELVANDVNQEPRYTKVDSLTETQSEAVLPLKIEGRIFGVFDIQSNELNAFGEDDLLVLRALADNIAIAIESTRLFQSLQHRADQLSAVSEVSRVITSILDTEELLTRIVKLIHKRFKFPYVHLYLVDPAQNKIVFKSGSGERTPQFAKAGISYAVDDPEGVIPWVVQHGQTKRINDVQQEPLYRKSPFSEDNTGSELAVPLVFGGEVLGVLDIQSDRKRAFYPDDQQVMETLADNIAIAIRNAGLYRSEKWRRQVAESLRDVAGLLSDNTALDNVLDTILSELHKNLPCDIAAIWLFDPEDESDRPLEDRELTMAAYKSAPGYNFEDLDGLSFVPDEWVKNALQQERPTIRRPGDSIGPIGENFHLDQEYSAIAAPLHTGSETLGMLTLTHHKPGRYGSESQKITSTFASYAAIAIENTRLYTSSQEQAWISTILLQVAQATQSQTNLNELVSTIVRLTPMVVGVKGCALFLREPESDLFSLYAIYNIGTSSDEITIDSPLPLPNAPILDEVMLTQTPLVVQNLSEDFGLEPKYCQALSGDRLVVLPLTARNETLGAFMLANETDFSTFDIKEFLNEDRLRIIQGIMQQTAVAIENIRLLESRQEEAYVSTVLLQVAQAVVSGGDLDEILDSIIHIMPILVGIDASLIYRWDEISQSFQVTHATVKNTTNESELIGMIYDPDDFPMLEAVFRNNKPLVHPFINTTLPPEDWDLVLPDEGQIDPTPLLQSQYPLLLGFPLSVKDETYGVLLAQDKNFATNRERRFELLWGIAQQASLAIQNDLLNKEMLDRQRLEREFQLAREIQQTFLPSQMPDIPGWEMDVHWETARQVGGDFYDYFILPDGRLAFVIADVSDKGLAASLYMTVTRTLLRAAALETTSPAETLERVNDLLLMNSQNGLFVTTFYGIFSLDDGKLTYTIAGHNPPMLIRSQQNQITELDPGGIALGALDGIKLEEQQLTLDPGDCLVLYTDGVTEAFNTQDQIYGENRLKKVLEATIGADAKGVLKAIEADLVKFRGDAPLSDDTTILAIFRSLTD